MLQMIIGRPSLLFLTASMRKKVGDGTPKGDGQVSPLGCNIKANYVSKAPPQSSCDLADASPNAFMLNH